METRSISFWQFLRHVLWPAFEPALIPIAVILSTLVMLVGATYVLTLVGVSKDMQTGIPVPLIVVGVLVGVWVVYRYPQPASLDTRLEKLAKSLQDARGNVMVIEAEIKARQIAVASLQARSQEFDQLAKVNEEAADAVAKVVERAVGHRERRSLLMNVGVGFVVGLFAGLAVDPIRAWITHLTAGHP